MLASQVLWFSFGLLLFIHGFFLTRTQLSEISSCDLHSLAKGLPAAGQAGAGTGQGSYDAFATEFDLLMSVADARKEANAKIRGGGGWGLLGSRHTQPHLPVRDRRAAPGLHDPRAHAPHARPAGRERHPGPPVRLPRRPPHGDGPEAQRAHHGLVTHVHRHR